MKIPHKATEVKECVISSIKNLLENLMKTELVSGEGENSQAFFSVSFLKESGMKWYCRALRYFADFERLEDNVYLQYVL